MMVWKNIFLVLVFLSLLLLTACWDKIEIEDRGFTIGASIDQAEKEDQFLFTQQIVIPSGIKGSAGQGGGGSTGGNDAFLNVKETGESMFKIVREVAAKTSRTPYYAHVKVILISEEVARNQNIGDIMDFFLRDPEMRRGTLILVAKGKAYEKMTVSAKNEKLPVMYIKSISKNTYKNEEIYPKTRMGDLHEYLLEERSFALTMIEKQGKTLELTNTAIFNGSSNQMVGMLKREGTIGLNFIKGEIKGGVIKVEIKGKPVLYEIYRAKTGVKANVRNKTNINFTIEVHTEGAIVDSNLSQNYLSNENLIEVEKKVESKIKKYIRTALTICQEEYNTDVFEFGELLRKNHYDKWEDIKKDWAKGENYFSQSAFDIKVKSIIRNTGSINQSKEE